VKRNPALRLKAQEGTTVSGPTFETLACGCVVDDIGGVWHPCAKIAPTVNAARDMARLGLALPRERRCGAVFNRRPWERSPQTETPPPTFEELLDRTRNHVANERRAMSMIAVRQRRYDQQQARYTAMRAAWGA